MPVTISPTDEDVRTRTGVVVTATHPVLGPLYWEFVSEVSVGGPDSHSVSTSMERALLLEPNWRDNDNGFYGNMLKQVIREQVMEHNDAEGFVILRGALAKLHVNSGQSEKEFVDWLKEADWEDAPGPTRIEHRVDHGYVVEWVVYSQTPPVHDGLSTTTSVIRENSVN